MGGWTVAAGGSIRRHFASMNSEFHENWQVRKPVVRGKRGVVVSHHRAAAEVGAAVLRDGGNAVDAAIATSFAVSVLEPWMSGIGGGGQMLIYNASDHRVSAVDCGMVAPAGLRVEDYPLGEGEGSDLFTWPPVLEDRNVTGYYSMAVPGLVDGLSVAHQNHATRSWAELLEPAIRLARRGLPVTWLTTLRVNDAAIDLRRFEASRAIYMPDGLPPPTARDGTVRCLPMGQLEATLQRLAEAGARDFYEGELAAKLVADVRAGSGSFDDQDLARYHASERDALTSTYAKVRVNAAPGLTAGPTLLDALSRIEGQMSRGRPPGPETYAIWASALAEAYEQRLATLGDEDESRAPGCTTHLSVMDGEGNIVCLTQTLLSYFGSRVVLPNTGILMNNGIMWFDPRPGSPNSIGPGKRPLTNMCPCIVTTDEHGWFALGASGGRRIMPAVFQVLSMLVDNGMDLESALHHPRLDVSGEHKAMLDARLCGETEAAVAQLLPVTRVEQMVLPRLFACPNGVLRDPASGEMFGAADVMSPVSGAVAA